MLVDEYGVGRATFYDIIKNRVKPEIFGSAMFSGPRSSKILQKTEHLDIESTLYICFLQERITEKAKNFQMIAHTCVSEFKNAFLQKVK